MPRSLVTRLDEFIYSFTKCHFSDISDMGLPLRMENLHAPTVASGPTSGPGGSNQQFVGLSFAQLQSKKDNLEAEIRALSSVLESVSGMSSTRA